MRELRIPLVALALLLTGPTAWADIIADDPCSPAEEHQFKHSGGPETAGIGYTLQCDGTAWRRVIEFDADQNVGVQKSAPKAPLHVGGELIVGETTGLNCDTDRRGGLRWNNSSSGMQVCNGSSWQGISGSGSAVAAGPEGAIQFNSSSALSGSGTFVYKSATGRVGIGTANPQVALEIVGSEVRMSSEIATFTVGGVAGGGSKGISLVDDGSAPRLSSPNGLPFFIGIAGQTLSKQTKWEANSNLNVGSGVLFVDVNNRRTGVNTTTPAGILQINTASANAKGLIVRGDVSQAANLAEWQNDSGTVLGRVDKDGKLGAPAYCDQSGSNCFNPASGAAAAGPDGAIQFNNSSALAGTSNFVYTSAGRVGIGVFAPSAWMEVAQSVSQSSPPLAMFRDTAGSGHLSIKDNNPLGGQDFQAMIYASNTAAADGLVIRSDTQFSKRNGMQFVIGGGSTSAPSYAFQFMNHTTPLLTITAPGKVGVQVTAPTGQLHVRAASAGAIGLIVQGAASQLANLAEWQNDSGTVLGRIDKDGKLGAPAYCDQSGSNCFNPASGSSAAGPEGAIQINSSSALSGSGNLVYTSAGRVGIGTAIPASQLDLASSAPAVRMTDTTASAKSLQIAVDANKAHLQEAAATDGSLLSLDLANNRMGVKTSTPSAPLDVNGEVKLGNSSLACGGTTAGALRYASGCVQFCNGTNWACISQTAGCDSFPDPFTFADQTSLTASTQYESNIIAIPGTDPACNSTISVSGQGSPNFRVCSDSICASVVQNWTATATSIPMNGPRYLQVRATTSADPSTTHNLTVSVGGVNDIWSISTVSTGACGDVGPGDEGTICADGTIYAGVSPDGNRNMYVSRCDLGQSWNGSACSGTRNTYSWNNGTTNYSITNANNSISGAQNTANLILMAANSDGPFAAAVACDGFDDGNGNTDWYLPAHHELNVIWTNLSGGMAYNGFWLNNYWSSTEQSESHATLVIFSTKVFSYANKINNSTHAVRCARRD